MSDMTYALYPIYFTLSVGAISFFRQTVEVGLWAGVLILGCTHGDPAARWHSKHDRLAVSELFLYLLLVL